VRLEIHRIFWILVLYQHGLMDDIKMDHKRHIVPVVEIYVSGLE
jgi:hypothetical protein